MAKTLCKSALTLFLAASLIVGLPSPVAAGIVSTSQALALAEEEARSVVDGYLARGEVEAQLRALGVDPEMARLRVGALSASELDELAGRIQEAPAGGDGALTVLGITFLVLLVLELVGVIDIFKKT